jgi:hypothetical protein
MHKKDKQHKKETKMMQDEIKDLKNIIKKKDQTIEKLKGEVLRLRTNNKKDSSNSSRPSSTNGYKKVITNSRQKFNNKPGKPKGFKSTNLSNEKLNQFINSGDIEYKIVEVNKNENIKNQKYKVVKVLDIKIIKEITEYRYYQNENGTYDIPQYHNRAIQYGTTLKTICSLLNTNFYNSTDGIKAFISDITNNGVTLAKSTILRWNNILANNFEPEISHIESSLSDTYYVNCDDSSIKINGQNYNNLCICDEKHTRHWISEKKDHEAWKNKTILDNYLGIIVKDGTDVFNGFGIALAQCNSHIHRYTKGVYDYINHSGAKELDDFLKKCIHDRKVAIKNGRKSYTKKELEQLYGEFDSIFKKWKKQWMKSKIDENPVYEDERKLLARFEDEKEREQILYFLKDFNIPATNSRAEVDQRGVKIKQKIGKFRSVEGAEDYAVNKSAF